MASPDKIDAATPRTISHTSAYSGFALAGVRTLGTLRAVIGLSSLLAPNLASELSGLSPSNDPTAIRLFGARDFVVGMALLAADGLCYKSSSDLAAGEARRHLSRALWIGVVIDAIDVSSIIAGRVQGIVTTKAVWVVGFGAAVFVGMGMTAIRNLT